MTQVSSAPELFDEEEDISPSVVFKRIYAFFYNKVVGVVLILLMAALAFIGTLIVQMPESAKASPESKAAWLESIQPKYGGWTNVLDFFGFFNMYSSPIFLTVSAMLALSIVACTVHRLRPMWRRATQPRVSVSNNFHLHAQNRTTLSVADVVGESGTDEAGAAAATRARDVLKSKRWRVLDDDVHPNSFYADKNRWGPFGTVLAHLAFILIMVAFILTSTMAYDEYLTVPVGGTAEVPGTNMTVTALSFQDSYTDEGRPSDYVSHIVVRDDDVVVGEQDIRVNDPLGYDGYRFHQTSFGIAAQATVAQADGTSDTLTAPLQWTSNDGTNSIGRLDIPGREDLEVLIVTPASGRSDSTIPPGAAMLEVYPIDSNQPLVVEELSQGEPFEWQGTTITFDRELQYTGITVRKDPATALMWIASFLLVGGMFMTFGFPHRRLWVRVSQDNESLQITSVDKHDAIYERQYRSIIAEIAGKEGALDDD